MIVAVENVFSLSEGSRGLIACDNLGGLNKSKQRRRKIAPCTKQADILRSLRRVHGKLVGNLRYKHVHGHTRKKKTWNQMTILEKLNDKCDAYAKGAVHRGIQESPPEVGRQRQLLPLETTAIFYDGQKIVGECGSEVRFQIGKQEARQYYITQLGWYAATFDNVDWKSRDNCCAINLICSRCGCASRALPSVLPVKTWVDGLAPNIRPVPTVMHQTRMQRTCSTVVMRADLHSIDQRLKQWCHGFNKVILILIWRVCSVVICKDEVKLRSVRSSIPRLSFVHSHTHKT